MPTPLQLLKNLQVLRKNLANGTVLPYETFEGVLAVGNAADRASGIDRAIERLSRDLIAIQDRVD